jgi:hypothetical protein
VTLVGMNVIKTAHRLLNERRPRDIEPRRPSPAWLERVERRLDEGDVLTAAELVLVRELLARPKPSR